MEKGGELKTRLSERLSQRQAEELAEVATLTEANLRRLGEHLTQLASAELSTTSSAIKRQSEQINTLLGSQQSALAQQQETVDALKRLSLADLEQIQDTLTTSLNNAQGEAITAAIGPLKTTLGQLNQDVAALRATTFLGWLKPLWIGLVICLSMGGLVWGAISLLQAEIDSKRQDLQVLKQEISQAEQTLDGLPKGVTLGSGEGKRYIVASKIGKPFNTTDGKMAVEVK